MDGFKHIFSSKTVWANIIGFLALVPGLSEYFVGVDMVEFNTHVTNLISAASFVASTIFRIRATKEIVVGARRLLP